MKISKQNAEHYIWGGNCDGWHLVKNQDLSVIYERMPVNSSEVRHYHNKAQQFFFILSGTATLEIDRNLVTLNTNEGIEIPALTPHQIFNDSNGDVEFLVISQPASKGDRIAVD